MKVDYSKFPDIPPGYSTNYNKIRNVYQVYRDYRVIDESLGKTVTKRETIGQIKDGKFTYSKLYLARKKNAELEQKLTSGSQQRHDKSKELAAKLNKAVKETQLDQRQQAKVIYPIEPIVLAALVSALAGETDCVAICQLLNEKVDFFRGLYPSLPKQPITHDVVYRSLLKIKAEQFDQFYQRFIERLVRKSSGKVLAGDGQACRATGRNTEASDKRGAYMLMNFYDSSSRVCLSQMIIADKTNEITVGPKMIDAMDVRDCIITADAMSCQMSFVNSVLAGGADYCLAVKGNQDKSFKELRSLFMTTHDDQIEVHCDEVELDHGRIEKRTVSLIDGHLLSAPLRQKWQGLEQGCIVRIRSQRTFKSSGHTQTDERFYISSLPADERSAQRLGEISRAHWSVENRLHWVLDMHFDQDRMQAVDPDYISNRVALNKLALAMLENYRYWLWECGKTCDVLSIKAAMRHCHNFDNALNCIAWSQGIV